MTEEPRPAGEQPPPPRERHIAESTLPSWVPTVIGAILVLMAGLAVYTGLRYRNPTLANGIIKRKQLPRAMTSRGAPGEPEPGASLVFPGSNAEANAPVPSQNRAEVSGGPGGVVATVRLSARRGMITNVMPDDAMIYVNGLAIGEAKQFNTVDEVYDFPSPGTYTIRIVAPGHHERQFVITADDNAPHEIARLDVKLD
jgi:hypothetical protein